MTEKEKYIRAFLDGYFSDKNFPEYNIIYTSALESATKLANKKWKQYKKQKLK
jgi:hypothetical protein